MRAVFVKVLLWTVQGLFTLLVFFWAFLLAKLAYLQSVGGAERVRTYIMHISTVSRSFSTEVLNPVQQVQAAYQALFLLLAITWGLRELSAVLRNQLTVIELVRHTDSSQTQTPPRTNSQAGGALNNSSDR
jgi:hypothetical protein